MGQGGTRQEEALQLDGLPLVKNRYMPVSLLGGGAFGRVFKVQDVKTKRLYALKTVPFTPYRKNVSRKQQRVIIKSAETESTLLSQLRHPNVVKLVDTFVIDRSPVSRLGTDRHSHLCMLLEYCHGSDLNDLLVKRETFEWSFPKDLTLVWFIRMLHTLRFVHKQEIIHRDLKPDNTLDDYKNMVLKLSDFGVGKDIAGNKLGRTISGQLFYTAPEVLKQSTAYDSRCDMWSFGLIFLQVFAQISIKTYQDAVNGIFEQIKTTPKLKERFARRYGAGALQGVQLLPMLNFMHENDLFHLVTDSFIHDAGVRKVLDCMICKYERRSKAAALAEMPIVRTWEYVLDRAAKIKVGEFDMTGVITILKIPDQILLTRCFEILKDKIGEDVRHVNDFVEGGGVGILFRRCGNMRSLWKQRWLEDIVSVLLRIIQVYRNLPVGDDRVEFLCQKVTGFVRQFGFCEVLKKLFQFKNSPEIYYFMYLLTLHSPSLSLQLTDVARPALMKMNQKNEVYIQGVLRNIAPFLDTKALEKLLELYQYNRVHFMAWARHLTPEMRKTVATRLLARLKRRDEREPPPDGPGKKLVARKVAKDILALIYTVRNQWEADLVKHKFQLHFPAGKMPAKNTRLKMALKRTGQRRPKKAKRLKAKQFVEMRKTPSGMPAFKALSDDRHVFVEMTSADPLCVLSPVRDFTSSDKAVEKAICYTELKIVDGGIDEDLFLGFKVGDNQLLLNCSSGTVGIWDGKQESEAKVPSIQCSAGTYVGAGLTNKGAAFFTHNNVLLQPFVSFLQRSRATASALSKDGGTPAYAHMKFKGNLHLQSVVNFGKTPFHYRFGAVTPTIKGDEPEVEVERMGVCADTVKSICDDPQNANLLKLVQARLRPRSLGTRLINKLFSILDPSRSFPPRETVPDEFLASLFHQDSKLHESAVMDVFQKELVRGAKSGAGTGSAKSAISARYSHLKQQIRQGQDLGDLHREELQKGKGRKKKKSLKNILLSRTEDDLLAMLPEHVLGLLGEEEEEEEEGGEEEKQESTMAALASLTSVGSLIEEEEPVVAEPKVVGGAPVAKKPRSAIDRIKSQERAKKARRGSVAMMLRPERSKVSTLFEFAKRAVEEEDAAAAAAAEEEEEEGEVAGRDVLPDDDTDSEEEEEDDDPTVVRK